MTKIGIWTTQGHGKGQRKFEEVDAASVRAEAETEGMEIIRAVAKISLRLDARSSGPDLLIVHGMQTECLLGLTPARVRQARAIVTAAERKEVMPVVSSAQDISTRRDVDTAPPTAGPTPEAGVRNAAIDEAATVARKYADDQKVVQHEQWTFMYRAAEEIETGIRALKQDAAPSPQPPAPVVSEETEEILEAIDSVIAQEAANRAIPPQPPAPAEGGTDVAGLITDLHKEIYNEYFDRDAVNKMFKRCAAALAAKEAEIARLKGVAHGFVDEISEKERRIEYLEGTLLHIEHMDVYTPEGEKPAHEVMRDIAREARLKKDPT